MTRDDLDAALRKSGGRIVSALAARYRNLDLAEEALATACAKAVERLADAEATDVAAWLYQVANRCALDAVRHEAVRARTTLPSPPPPPTAEEVMSGDAYVIPDERLRLIFVCCHPAVAPDARAALTLRIVCGLTTEEIARAFVVSEPAMAQRIVRAKRKIAEAGIPFEVPRADAWVERLEAVLTTIEVAYAKAHEDAAGTSLHADFANETLHLARILAELLPTEPDVLALAATVHYAEARRPARVDARGRMIPLSQQDPARWSRPLLTQADAWLRRCAELAAPCARELEAAIHAAWCARPSLETPPPWAEVLTVYDLLLGWRDDPIVRANRAVAVAEIHGVDVALREIDALDAAQLHGVVVYHVVRADLLLRSKRDEDAIVAYRSALALGVAEAERRWIEDRIAAVRVCSVFDESGDTG